MLRQDNRGLFFTFVLALATSLTLVLAFRLYISCCNYVSKVKNQNTTATEIPLVSDERAKTLKDLNEMILALEKYKQENRMYPISKSKIPSGWVGRFDYSGNENSDWIPNLAPEYLKYLPRDPRNSITFEEQYLYQSNGANYKLTANHPLECDYLKEHHPELIDPTNHDCRYGYWTPTAKFWRY